MRKTLCMLGMLVSIVANAQIQKKDVFLGGSVGFGASRFNENPQQNFGLSPVFQYAYRDNRTVGFTVDIQYNTMNASDIETSNLGLTTGLRFTQFHPVKNQVGWLLQQGVSAAFNHSKQVAVGQTVKRKSESYLANVSTGVYYMPGTSGKWLLWADVGGLTGGVTPDNDNWFLNLSLFRAYNLGFAYNLRRRG